MRKDNKEEWILLGLLVIPVIWGALLCAPYMDGGLFSILGHINSAFETPFQIAWCDNTPRTLLLFLLIYGFGIGIYASNLKNHRRKEEYGSAKWGNVHKIKKKYADKDFYQNKILTQNFLMGLDGRKHRRNLNTIIIGGSGAGKTRFYGKVQILQCNTSFIVLDCKGEILRDTGKLLEKQGYVIKVFDLINMDKSHGYNPFAYIQDDKDVLKLITNLIRNTTPKGTQSPDPFWEKSETALLEALLLYLLHEAPEEEQNFSMVMEMIASASVREDDEDYQSPLDELFERLEIRSPNSLAVKQFKIYKQAAGKTAKSILISVGVRLAAFNLDSIAGITNHDELELDKVGERKTAIFAVIPDNDATFNFLVGMLYTQLFQMLYYQADVIHDGALPIPVHFLMDEFANGVTRFTLKTVAITDKGVA